MAQVLMRLAVTTTVALTGYSSVEAPGVARWGVDPWPGDRPIVGITAACPVAWKGHLVCLDGAQVPGYEGLICRLCQDTGAYDYLPYKQPVGDMTTLPHIDLFVGSDPQPATLIGVRPVDAWVSREPYPPECFYPANDMLLTYPADLTYDLKWCQPYGDLR